MGTLVGHWLIKTDFKMKIEIGFDKYFLLFKANINLGILQKIYLYGSSFKQCGCFISVLFVCFLLILLWLFHFFMAYVKMYLKNLQICI